MILNSPTGRLLPGFAQSLSLRPASPTIDMMEGEGYIGGTITISGVPSPDIVVKVYSTLTGQLIKTGVTDSFGGYIVDGLKIDQMYDVSAQDPELFYERQVSSRRYPVSIFNVGSPFIARADEVLICELTNAPAFMFTTSAGEEASSFLAGVAFRYIRLWITAVADGSTSGYINVDRIHMREYSGGDNLANRNSSSGTATQSTNYLSSYPAEPAFEGTGLWHTTNQAQPWWARYDFGVGNAYSVNHLTIRPANALPTSRSPGTFKVQGSNNDSTWTDLASFTGVTGWALGVEKTFSW